jgi:hypothetical protein
MPYDTYASADTGSTGQLIVGLWRETQDTDRKPTLNITPENWYYVK